MITNVEAMKVTGISTCVNYIRVLILLLVKTIGIVLDYVDDLYSKLREICLSVSSYRLCDNSM